MEEIHLPRETALRKGSLQAQGGVLRLKEVSRASSGCTLTSIAPRHTSDNLPFICRRTHTEHAKPPLKREMWPVSLQWRKSTMGEQVHDGANQRCRTGACSTCTCPPPHARPVLSVSQFPTTHGIATCLWHRRTTLNYLAHNSKKVRQVGLKGACAYSKCFREDKFEIVWGGCTPWSSLPNRC